MGIYHILFTGILYTSQITSICSWVGGGWSSSHIFATGFILNKLRNLQIPSIHDITYFRDKWIFQKSYDNTATKNKIKEQNKYDLQWYVIGTTKEFKTNTPYKKTIWGKNYVIWKTEKDEFYAMNNECVHRSASLADGFIQNKQLVCPYHKYEYDSTGCLVNIPGTMECPRIYNRVYSVVERNGWLYLNIDKSSSLPSFSTEYEVNIYQEPEAIFHDKYKVLFLEMDYSCNPRLVAENMLDILHMMGKWNVTYPQNTPQWIIEKITARGINKINGPEYHAKDKYKLTFPSRNPSEDSTVLYVDTEFILPHTTIIRVYYSKYILTIIGFALPLSENKTRVYVKLYRNFLIGGFERMGDWLISYRFTEIMKKDKKTLEGIIEKKQKVYTKFDNLQNLYRTYYNQWIYNKELPQL